MTRGLTGGSRLGPYEIVAPIGAGGMGEVYRARDMRLNRTVAIKVLPPDIVHDPLARARFERKRAPSQTGTLVYQSGHARTTVSWHSRSGTLLAAIDDRSDYRSVRISDDAQGAAVVVLNGIAALPK